ncbi:hypothetical protein ACFFSH_10285 [Streptomyces filamentosus]|uniref:Uncharacterized protein n=1 Tax=Streptomyces filamentosus TaxID=67294 RepID=A0A919BH09_STRFL|nr:hypothetical protein [Streptomyces filamentosus]GHF88609.1 hypothetical protein GCM10017667_16710 [Streptomyces filamentosus]
MLLHEFRPGRLVVGVAALALAGAYGGELAGRWSVPWWLVVPVMCGALGVAGLLTWVAYGVRRRSARSRSAESVGAPASSSGSQAMR